MQFPISGKQDRAGAWKRLFPRVRQSLYQGDVLLYHCMAGRHRGAAAGVVTVAVMGRMTIREAEESILKRRSIQLRQAFRDEHLADWAHKTVTSTTLPPPVYLICLFENDGGVQRNSTESSRTDKYEKSIWPGWKKGSNDKTPTGNGR